MKKISSDDEGFSSWMRKYLSPKEYYLIKSKNFHKISILEFKETLDAIFKESHLNSDIKLIEYLIRVNTKLEIILKIIRSGFINRNKIKKYYKNSLLLQILSYRISNHSNLSLNSTSFLKMKGLKSDSFNIVGPVCPDYSYINTNDGRYRYTFESVGSGIGLVAQKTILNFAILKDLSKDLINCGLNLKFQILIGDFEANEQNLISLNELKSDFLDKVNNSRILIENKTGIKTDMFTNFCLGLDGWKYQINQIKYIHNLYNFNDLYTLLPNIKHEKKLISRLPLYKKWFGESADFKDIFLSQVLEYILMGCLVKNRFNGDAAILASDHKAMRDYYSSISEINIISSSANY